MLVTRFDRVIVSFRSARLNDRGDAGSRRDIGAVAKREEGVGSQTEPAARAPAFSTAIRTESSRLIWPAPTPTTCPSFASTIAFDFTDAQTHHANARSLRSASVGARRVGTWPEAGSASSRSQL